MFISPSWFLLLAVICTCRAQSWQSQLNAVPATEKNQKIKVILVLDFVGSHSNPEQRDDIITFVKKLYNGINDGQLWLNFIELSNVWVSSFPSGFASKNQEAGFIDYLKANLASEQGHTRFFARALDKAKTMLESDNGPRNVVLITHGKENCTPSQCKDCCADCDYCDDWPCRKLIESEDVRFFVTNQAKELKESSVKLITVGVGTNTDPSRLKFWASDNMFIALNNYTELPIRGANSVLKLIKVVKSSTMLSGPAGRAVATIRTISSTLLLTTKWAKVTRESSGNGLEWYIWVLVVAAVLVISSAIAVALIGAIMWWWKRKKRTMVQILHKKYGRCPAKYRDKPLNTTGWKPGVSFVYSAQSDVVKDHHFVADQSCKQAVDRFSRPGIKLVRPNGRSKGVKQWGESRVLPISSAPNSKVEMAPSKQLKDNFGFRTLN